MLSQEFISKNHSDSEAFVTILYRAFFNRQPDSYGMNAWLSRMKAGQTRSSGSWTVFCVLLNLHSYVHPMA
ncbi:MAG: DUF4214 domain-containing protein [Actinomycetota bacterium]|nr:DUF4214 domain-containing protein [Actinomycetota bacterium]